MKFKHVIIIVTLLLILFNTLSGGIIEAYEMSSCLMVDLGLVITAGMFYYLFASSISDGFKITVAIILSFTGIIRSVCMGIMGTDVQNNVALLIAFFILIIEIALLFVASYLSNK